MIKDKEMPQGQFIKVIIKKKPICIPIFHSLPSARNRIKTDSIQNFIRINHAPKLSIIDAKLEEIPKTRSLNVSTYNFSQTPTPREQLRASYFSQNFDTPKTSKHTSNTLSADYREQGNTEYSTRRKTLKSDPCSKNGSRIRVFRDKITMKDLNLNLPIIIKSKKLRKRISYNHNFGKTINNI